MTTLFVKVALDDALWVLDNVRYTERPPDARCTLELTAAMMDGRLHRYTQRAWAARWHCSRGKVRSIASKVAATCWPVHQWTTQGPPKDQWGTTLGQSFQHLTTQGGTTQGPPKDRPVTYARASSIKKEEGKKEEEQQGAQAPASVSTPKAKTPKALEAEQGLECLRTLRGELHQAATGKRHTANWGKGAAGKVLARKIARLLDECRGRELDPLPCLEALARWVYGAPGADWLRSRSSPLVDALGGNALTRASRVDDALAWVAGGQVESRPTKSKGRTRPQDEPPGAWDAFREDEQPRTVINPLPFGSSNA